MFLVKVGGEKINKHNCMYSKPDNYTGNYTQGILHAVSSHNSIPLVVYHSEHATVVTSCIRFTFHKLF